MHTSPNFNPRKNMPEKRNEPAGPADREIVITRVVSAPRELVWEAMTRPEHVTRWWGPRGFTTQTEVMDVRPGGAWKHTMIGPDGARYPNKSVFREVVAPERIVYSHGGAREGDPGLAAVRAGVALRHRGRPARPARARRPRRRPDSRARFTVGSGLIRPPAEIGGREMKMQNMQYTMQNGLARRRERSSF